jgi:hypothetical protein
MHQEYLRLWYLQSASTCVLGTSVGAHKFGLATVILSADAMGVAQSLAQNTVQPQACVDALQRDVLQQQEDLKQGVRVDPLTGERAIKKKKAWPVRLWRGCGLCTRPTKATYTLIQMYVLQTVSDIAFTLLLVCLLLHPFCTVGLIREFVAAGQCNPARYPTRAILLRTLSEVRRTVVQTARFCFFLFFILLTVGGLPRFLQELFNEKPSNMKEAADIAQYHAKRFLVAICNVLGLVFAFRTYRLVFKAAVFAVMVPGK